MTIVVDKLKGFLNPFKSKITRVEEPFETLAKTHQKKKTIVILIITTTTTTTTLNDVVGSSLVSSIRRASLS